MTADAPHAVALRLAVETDHEWLYRLHEQAHRELVERAYGPWEEGQQRDFFRPLIDDHDVFILVDAEEPVGAVYLAERDDDVWLELVEVLPAHQRRGYGTRALRWVVERAAAHGKNTLLQVHRVNDDARRLYLSEGFVEVDETPTHHLLRKTLDD